MARDFRSSRYRGSAGVGEDVNPSAYIVNLADCMLVLACGFLVALVSFYNIQMAPVTELEEEDLEQVEPEQLPDELLEGGGSYYVEAGKVYRDPNTGVLYMVENVDDEEASGSSATPSGTGTGATGAATGVGTGAGSASTSAREARANGAD